MASDGQIRIIIGASMSREVEETFGGIEKRAERCGRVVQKMLGGSGTGAGASGAAALGRGFRAAASESDKSSKAIEADFAKQIKAAEKASNAEWKAFKKLNDDKIKQLAASERAQDKAQRQETRNAEREADRQTAVAERAIKKIDSEHQRFASRVSQRSVRFLFPNPTGAFGMAGRIGGDILRGAGVDFSVAGSVSRAVNVGSLSTQLSNQGYRAGDKGPAGTRVEGSVLESEARKVGKDLSVAPEKLLEAQTKFVDVTGDLDQSRKNMKGLAEIAIATHTDFTAMAEAAGNISRHLEDTPDKAERLAAIMRVLAGQGKVGSIEIKDFAAQMAKIAAIAPKFSGDVGTNITKLTTIAQLSRAEGGSATAAQAATATARFADTFTSKARLKQFSALGIDPYTDSKHTQLKDPFEIIRQSIDKTKGSATRLADLFKSVMSQRAISALSNAYNQAGGGKAGMTAVNSQLATFGKESAITKEEVAEDVAKNQETIAAKAQKFQDELDEIVSKIANDVIPTFEKLEPTILSLADGFSTLIKWTSSNPGDAIMAAIVAAIGRATLESGFRSLVEKIILSALPGGAATGVAGGVVAGVEGEVTAGALGAGAAGAAGIGLLPLAAIALLTIGTIKAGTMLVDHSDLKEKEDNPHDTPTNADKPKIETAVQDSRKVKSIDDLYGPNTNADDVTNKNHNDKADEFRALLKEQDDKASARAHIDHEALAESVTRGMRSGAPLPVTVANMPGSIGAPPPVNPGGRSPDPGLPRSWN